MNLVPVALDGVTLIFMFHVYITVKIFAVQIIEGYVMLTGASKHVASNCCLVSHTHILHMDDSHHKFHPYCLEKNHTPWNILAKLVSHVRKTMNETI